MKAAVTTSEKPEHDHTDAAAPPSARRYPVPLPAYEPVPRTVPVRPPEVSENPSDPHDPILYIQRSAGNLDVSRAVRAHRTFVQAQIGVSRPDDALEEEADRIAGHIVSSQ